MTPPPIVVVASLLLYPTATVAVLLNAVILYVAYKSPSLHTCFHLNIMLAVTDGLTGVAAFTWTAIWLNEPSDPTETTLAYCLFESFPWVFAYRFTDAAMTYVAGDRLMAVSRPFAYRLLNHERLAAQASVLLFAIALGPTQLAGYNFTQCPAGGALIHPTYARISMIIRVLFWTLIIVSYAIQFKVVVLRRKSKVQPSASARSNNVTEGNTYVNAEQQKNITAVILLVSIGYIAFMVVPSLCYHLALAMDAQPLTLGRFSVLLTYCSLLNAANNFFIYIFRHARFRKAIQKVFGHRTNYG